MAETVKTHALRPWRFFDATASRMTRLSPTFLRLTFEGVDLDVFADLGFDARVKVVLPTVDGGYRHLPRDEDWYARWRSMPKQVRNPLRSYTTRYVRADQREIDVDFVLHGDTGPASCWATHAQIGAPVVLLGPDSDAVGPHGGVEFVPPEQGDYLIMAGDESAAPAILTTLGQLPLDVRGHAFIEVPDEADRLPINAPTGMAISWLVRGVRPRGELLVSALSRGGHVAGGHKVWLAGEQSVVHDMRRSLMTERGIDKRQITFRGYWRRGRASG